MSNLLKAIYLTRILSLIFRAPIIVSGPADPLSVALAYRAAIRAHVPEAALSYGPRKNPIDQPTVKVVKTIPEELIFHSDKPILELKPHASLHSEPIEEEVEEEVEEEEDESPKEEVAAVDLPGLLAYHEIGYMPEVPKEAKFHSHHYHHQAEDHHNLKSGVGCQDPPPKNLGNCGFKLGGIVHLKRKASERHFFSV